MMVRIREWRRVAVGTLAAWSCAPPAIPEPPDPFVAPRAMVVAMMDRVVLTPVVAPPDLAVSPEALGRIDLALEVVLPAAGIPVVPVREYAAVWERIIRQVGGFFDPYTGARDDRKFEWARALLLDELEGRYGTGILIYPEIQYVDAKVTEDVARWDGVSESMITDRGRLDSALTVTYDREPGGHGVVSALSLLVTVDAADGTTWYSGFGGLEVLAGRGPEDATIFYLRANTDRVHEAVEVAIRPLRRDPDTATADAAILRRPLSRR